MKEATYTQKPEWMKPKDAWDALSMKEKAAMMEVAVKNGITNLRDIRAKYNEFAEGGDISDEEYYSIMEKVAKENNSRWNEFRIKEGMNPLSLDEEYMRILNDNAYNYRGYYSKYPQSRANADTHWPDEFKTAYHPTFSVESKYSGQKSQYNPQGLFGGHWVNKDNFIPAPWQKVHAHGGPMGIYYDGWGNLKNKLRKGINKARQIVHDWGLDRSPAEHLSEVFSPIPGSSLGILPTALINTGKKLGVDKVLRGKDSDTKYRQNLYNTIDPTSDIPEEFSSVLGYGLSALASKYGKDEPYSRTKTDSVADAAWAKRLGLPYNTSALIDNGDGTFRLPKEVEEEIPVDTTFLRNRIASNQEELGRTHGVEHRIKQLAIDTDTKALEALRKTYATGEPVGLDEHSYVNRLWRGHDTNNLEISPLNVMKRYTVQYDKDNNEMKYWDWYDFNEFEDFVPGNPYKIQGSIKLKKSK